jgi:tetratricopeptide (TPR) repeat protein
MGLGRLDEAVDTLKRAITLDFDSRIAVNSLSLIRDINTEQGVRFDLGYFDRDIDQDPNDAVAYYLRGLAHLALGNPDDANRDVADSYRLGLYQEEVRINIAYTRFKTGDLSGVERDLMTDFRSNPNNALLNTYLGELYMSQMSPHWALDFLETANALDPDLGLAWLDRAKIFVSLGMEESAKAVLDSATGLTLPTAQDYVDRGQIHAYLGDYNAAFADLDEAIRINPAEAKHYNARAKTYANMSSFEAALNDFDIAIQLDATEGKYFINRGVIYEILGEGDRSFEDFKIADILGETDTPPDRRNAPFFAVYTDTTSADSEARQRINLEFEREAIRTILSYSGIGPGDAYENALQNLAQAYRDLDMWVLANHTLSELIEISPGSPELYRAKGDTLLALSNTGEAIDDYISAVRLDPRNGDYLVSRAKGYSALGEYDLARNDLNEAIRLDPNSSDAYASRGYLLVQTGDSLLAFQDINRAIAISPLNHDAIFKRANAHIELGQTPLAFDDLDRALQLAPTNFGYLYNRGLLHRATGDLRSAREDFDGAIALKAGMGYVDPRHSLPFIDRGRILLQSGNPSQSLDDANKAVELLDGNFVRDGWGGYAPSRNQHLSQAYELQGDAYNRLGRFDEARQAYLRSQQTKP